MKITSIILFLICFIAGCSPVFFQPIRPGEDYRWYIERWQQIVKNEGWSEAIVDDVIFSCLVVSKYEKEPSNHDHWKSFGEFQLTFRGDCEDIATFMYGTLKRLACPYDLKMRIIRMPAGDHAVLMVNVPDGWKMYNSLPTIGDFIDISMARVVVEWDDQQIYYPMQKGAEQNADIFTRSHQRND